jgi:hypothetical protein
LLNVLSSGNGLNGFIFIQKPFQAKDLMNALQKILEVSPGVPA